MMEPTPPPVDWGVADDDKRKNCEEEKDVHGLLLVRWATYMIYRNMKDLLLLVWDCCVKVGVFNHINIYVPYHMIHIFYKLFYIFECRI